MPHDETPSAPWSSEAVLTRLRNATASGRTVSASFTVGSSVPYDQVEARAGQIVKDAGARLGLTPGEVRLGKVHPRAKSFSVSSASPDVFAEIVGRAEVDSIVETEQPGMLIEPRDRKAAP